MFSFKKEYPQFYSYKGRKISKKVSFSKKNLINNTYNQFSIDESVIKYQTNKRSKKKIIFPKIYEKINVEIGFGNGEFLIQNALANPKELYIGVEVYLNGIAKVLSSISDLKIKNIILSNLNCFYFLDSMPNKSLDKIFIINPDPWIKRRHKKRRLMTCEIIKLLKKVTKSKNSIYMTTDSKSYLKDTENLLIKHKKLFGDYNLRALSEHDDLYGISRYQRKAIEKGRKIYLLTI